MWTVRLAMRWGGTLGYVEDVLRHPPITPTAALAMSSYVIRTTLAAEPYAPMHPTGKCVMH